MPKDIFEIVFHARAGQGAKSAAQMIAETALDEGKCMQAFPEYGPERAGAPMKAYARISKKPIKTYAAIENPDAIVIIDPSILTKEITSELSKDGVLVVNTCESIDNLRKATGFQGRILTVDATGIALEAIGDSLPNTAILGALVKATDAVSLKFLLDRVKRFFMAKNKSELAQANVNAIKRGYAEVKESTTDQ